MQNVKGSREQTRFEKIWGFIQKNRITAGQMRSFDWFAFFLMLAVALFGVVCIFAATAVPVEQKMDSVLEALSTQPITYARLQLIWILVGTIMIFAILYFDYKVFENFSSLIYWLNIALLTIVLFMERGRGNMAGWFRWGADSMRTLQPSEFGKLAIIIALAKLFANRKRPIHTVTELLPVLAYVGVPLILIVSQPDVGTALVYIAIFAVMLFVSGTSYKLIIGMLSIAVLTMIPLLYYMNTSNNFRSERIMVFLDPTYDPNGWGMQTTNARIAIGSAGFWGKGMFSEGSFASLNYIPDDYTDFIFAIVCETFGFVGAGALVAALLVMLLRLITFALQVTDAFGRYFIVGYMAMLFFHILENIGMIVGLLPVTGIPLSFISYGGSNLLTNMIGYGLVLNIVMRGREKARERKEVRPIKL